MPSPAAIIQRIRSRGANVILDGNSLKIIHRSKLPDSAMAFIRENGLAIAGYLAEEAEIEERSAIMEHDGGLPRDAADHCANLMIAGIPKGISEYDRGFYISAICRICDEVFHPAGELARAA